MRRPPGSDGGSIGANAQFLRNPSEEARVGLATPRASSSIFVIEIHPRFLPSVCEGSAQTAAALRSSVTGILYMHRPTHKLRLICCKSVYKLDCN